MNDRNHAADINRNGGIMIERDGILQLRKKSPVSERVTRTFFMAVYVLTIAPFTVSFFIGVMPLPAVIKNSSYAVFVWWCASGLLLAFIESRSVKLAVELWSVKRVRDILATLTFFLLLQTLPMFSIVYDVLGNQYQQIVLRANDQKNAIAKTIGGNRAGISESNRVIGRVLDAYTAAEPDTSLRAESQRRALMSFMNRVISQRSIQLNTDTKLVGDYNKTLLNLDTMTPELEFVTRHMLSWPSALALLFPLSLLAAGFSLREKREKSSSIADILRVAETLPHNLQPSIRNTLATALNAAISSDYFRSRQHVSLVDLIVTAESNDELLVGSNEILKRVEDSRLSPEIKESVKQSVKDNLYSKLKMEDNHVNN